MLSLYFFFFILLDYSYMQLCSFLKKLLLHTITWCDTSFTMLCHDCSTRSRKSLYTWSYCFMPLWIISQWVLDICTWTENSQRKMFSLDFNSLSLHQSTKQNSCLILNSVLYRAGQTAEVSHSGLTPRTVVISNLVLNMD